MANRLSIVIIIHVDPVGQLDAVDHSMCCLVPSKRSDCHCSIGCHEKSKCMPDLRGPPPLFFGLDSLHFHGTFEHPIHLRDICTVTYPCKTMYIQTFGNINIPDSFYICTSVSWH